MQRNTRHILAGVCFSLILFAGQALCGTVITGPYDEPGVLRKWHKVEITFDGPSRNETSAATFTDDRLDVRFTPPSGPSFWVPGFFAADGDAADTGSGSGNKWRVRLNPDMEGLWSFTARFRTGSWVAVNSMSSPGGSGGTAPDGETGAFTIMPSDKDPYGRDFRGKGQLQYVNTHHCRFAESGEYFIKGGADSPEDFIAYNEIDNTPTDGHDYAIHKTNHYSAADASSYTWKSGKGKGILGAIRYMAELQEMNNFYVIMITAPQGDSKDVFPWISTNSGDREKYDVSKLEQWERVFSYGDKKGIHWNLLFTETENDEMICGGFTLCNLEKLYYREMIARFSHHHAVSWNVGEEYSGGDNGWGSAVGQRIALMMDLDPYSHTYTCHSENNQVWSRYDNLLGISNTTSNQQESDDYSDSGASNASGIHAITRVLKNRSASAGLPMVVYIDEANGPVPRCGSDMDAVRKGTLWANLMSGGAGVEWYLAYDCSSGWHDHKCLEDFTKMECVWSQTRYALRFFMAYDEPLRKPVPFHNMQPDDARASGTYNWCFYGADDDGKMCVVVYLRDGGSSTVNVPAAPLYKVGWMNAETGAWQYEDNIVNHPGGNITFTAPNSNDWSLLLYDWQTVVDNDPPTPDPAKWYIEPTATGEREITMTAVEGTDGESPPVEYYFAETSGNCNGADSGWQLSRTYTQSNLVPGTQYTYKVRMRDQAGNTTGWSSEENATTQGVADTDPPTPDPAEFDILPYAEAQTSITMSAVEGTDAHGPVEYYFGETSGNPGGTDSGWQTDPTYTDTDLEPGTQYTYTVKMRDTVCNETQPADPIIACTRPDMDIVPDGQINMLDLEKIVLHWLEDNCSASGLCQGSDLDASDWVDLYDFAILAANWMAFTGPQTIDLTYNPIDDAYVQDSTGYNNQELKVQPSGPVRISYLKFDIDDIPINYDVTSVELELTEKGDTGNGTLRFYRGSHNNWTEETISGASAPDTQDQVGVRSGSVGGNQTITVDVAPLVTANAVYTIIITMDAGGNDIWFGSKESLKVPKLTVAAQRRMGPPRRASNPHPYNGATNVDINADLSWTAGVDATSHDVYFGTTEPLPFVWNQTAKTFDPGTMTINTTYYWRIDEVGAYGTTTGPVWSFTTESGPPPP